MAEVEIRNAEAFRELAHRIKTHADAKALKKELYSGLNRATKGVRANMKRSIAPSLPRRGGLAAQVSKGARLSTRKSTSAKGAGISIRAGSKGGNLASMNDRGTFKHPVWKTGVWVEQSAGVTPHFLDRAFEHEENDVRAEVIRTLESVARKVEGL